jgi:hypothetical protein
MGAHHSFATPSLTVFTGKHVYEYGDFLSITFQVSELTGNPIIVHIIDSFGKASAPINISINKLNSTISSPIPFYKTTYSPGMYHINAEYAGTQSSISFDLVDSGKIAIPTEYKTLAQTWLKGTAIDKDYAGLIRELIHFDIINVPGYDFQTAHTIHIPAWFKNNVKWWSDDSITDNEFGFAIQYLINSGYMSI